MEVMPEFTRPDKIGVMFRYDFDEETWNPFARTCVIATPVESASALKSPAAQACFQMFWGAGKPVWAEVPGKNKFLIAENGSELLPHQLMTYEQKIK